MAEPGIVFEDRANAAPGLHVLIVGVSCYDYLGGGPAPPRPEFRQPATQLAQLSGPALSAAKLAQFFVSRKAKWGKPLSTCRVLLSPARDGSEDAGLSNFEGWARASYDNLKLALTGWHDDAAKDTDGAALFYFSGHGIQRSPGDAVLLPADFLGGTTYLDRAVDVNQIYNGMAPSKLFPDMARQQFFFIDACQADFSIFRDFPSETTPPIFIRPNSGADSRVAPIYYAAAPGRETFAVQGDGTRFGTDLLNSLRGLGGCNASPGGLPAEWCVTVGSLAEALEALRTQFNDERGFTIRTSRIDKFTDTHTVLHRLDGPPVVDCILRFLPDNAAHQAKVSIGMPWDPPFNPLMNPHKFTRPAGFYFIKGDSPPFQPYQQPLIVEPPFTTWTVQFS